VVVVAIITAVVALAGWPPSVHADPIRLPIKLNLNQPDLVVAYSGATLVDCSTQIDRFTITNNGPQPAGAFRVAVLAGQHTFSFTVSGLGPHQSTTRELLNLPNHQPVAILVDVDGQVDEFLETNNGTGFTIHWIACW
jgi:hypothetical protein